MRLLTLFCVVAMAVAFAIPAQAAVQNVKVGGDITIRGICQETYDLDDDDDDTSIGAGDSGAAGDSEGRSIFMSTVGINLDADLTDNVSAAIRIVNQRDWNIDATVTAATDMDIDLANITLKEMLYSPLTVTIGRQDIWIGDGFIIGANLQNTHAITAGEYTEIASFDAIRGVLDYDPWTIDLLYIHRDEGTTGGVEDDGDEDIYGVNVGYVFGQYNAEAEAYWFAQSDRNADAPTNETHTVGARGSFQPLDNLDLRGEMALQFGDYNNSGTEIDRDALGVDVRGEYCWADYAWVPTLGLEYVYFSGDPEDADDDVSQTGDYEGWNAPYRGKTWSKIREWQEVFYATDDADDTSALTNEHKIIVDGSIQPVDNILLEARFLHFLMAEDDSEGEDDLGDEIDLTLTYDYTEDVTFSLLCAWFLPGDVCASDDSDTASEVVGTVALVF